jgi:two-component system, cell cycle response regulator DivK
VRDRERAALERMSRVGGAALVAELAELYLEDLPARIARTRAALAARDSAGLAKAAHALRSSSAQLGAEALTSACDAVEDAAERGDIESAALRVTEIEREADAFAEWLSAHVGAQQGPGSDSSAIEPARAPHGAPRIAVIEDNADNRLLIDAILGDLHALEEYAGGSEALAAMALRPPDLVLLDVSLPGMDGLSVLARMRANAALRAIPVVAVTAHAMIGDRERYLAAGFDGYVAKPIVDEQVLVEIVQHLLEKGRDQPSARSAPTRSGSEP